MGSAETKFVSAETILEPNFVSAEAKFVSALSQLRRSSSQPCDAKPTRKRTGVVGYYPTTPQEPDWGGAPPRGAEVSRGAPERRGAKRGGNVVWHFLHVG